MRCYKKDFTRIANEFREVRGEILQNPDLKAHVAILYLENRLTDLLRESNPDFNGETFRWASRPENWSTRA